MMNSVPNELKVDQEPFKSTRAKQADWESIESYYNYLRAHRPFKRIDDNNLYVFAKNSLVENEQGQYSLLFDPKQEMASYFDTPFVNEALKDLNTLDVPYTIIVGKPSMFISNEVRKVWEDHVPVERIIELSDNGHLLPMEAPEQCATIIIKRFSSNIPSSS